MKAIRYLVLALVGLIVLAVVAVGVAIFVINPNDYKPQIEQVVEDKTNLDLILAGDIGWSIIPLGLELNDVEAKLDGERLVKLNRLVAQVDFWSLIAMSPKVDTFLLDGLDARLTKNKQGQGNWTRIMPESGKTTAAPETPAAAAGTDVGNPPASGGGEPLKFNVNQVTISNAQIHYDDQATGQAITLKDFSLNASDIALGQSFPLKLGFSVTTTAPKLSVDGNISAQITANEALNSFTVAKLDSSFDLSGEPFGGKTVTAGLTGDLAANLDQETARVSNLKASLANLELTTNLDVTGFGDKPTLKGNIAVSEFSLRKLLDAMGQADIKTSDPEVLKALAFSTDIGGPKGKVELSNVNIKVDDSSFKGKGSFGLANSAVALTLHGDSFNADRYLPPASDEPAPAASESKTTAAPADESDLLPLDTVRALDLNIDLGLDKLVVKNLTINQIKTLITANKGLVKLSELSAKLYEGGIKANATLDARTDNPAWSFSNRIDNVQTLPLLTDLADVTMLAGGANLTMDVTSHGNRLSALRSQAKGQIDFNLAKGEFRKLNLTHYACQGIALVNQDSLTKTDWADVTPFNDMKGTLVIDGNTLNNKDLVAALAGMKLEGNGQVHLDTSKVDYKLGLKIVGEIDKDKACRVTEVVQDVVIPVECKGDYSKEPGKLCSFDGSRFRDTLKTIAANAAKKKATSEVQKAVDDKLGKQLDKKLDSETSGKVKDAIKGLFK